MISIQAEDHSNGTLTMLQRKHDFKPKLFKSQSMFSKEKHQEEPEGQRKRTKQQFAAVGSSLNSFPAIKESRYSSLQMLDLSKNKFTYIPKEIQQLTSLVSLIMDQNLITSLNNLGQLPNLRNLSLCNNLIDQIGADIKCLRELEILDVSINHILQIDDELYLLPKLTSLQIHSNEYQSISACILNLRNSLTLLGFGWGQFCEPKLPILLKDGELAYWFRTIQQMEMAQISFATFTQRFSFNPYNQQPQESSIRVLDSYDESIFEPQGADSDCTQRRGSILLDSPNTKYFGLLVEGGSIELEQNCLINESVEQSSRAAEAPNIICIEAEPQFDWSTVNQYNQNAIHLAVIHNEIGALLSLLEIAPGLANQLDLKGHTPLSLAIERHKYRLARVLITKGSDVRIGGGLHSSNLHLAALSLQWALAKDLILHGADPNCQDDFGDTALHTAARGSQFELVVDFLREITLTQTDINRTNAKASYLGQSVLEILCEKGNLCALYFCHEYNIKNLQMQHFDRLFLFSKCNTKNGNSLLHVAIQQMHLQVVCFLLKYSLVSVSIENFSNQTPYQVVLAIWQQNRSYSRCVIIMKLLKSSFIRQIGSFEGGAIMTDENDTLPLVTQFSCRFTKVQQNIVNPLKYIKFGDDIEEMAQLEMNEVESHIQEHPCIKRQRCSDDSGELSMVDEQSPRDLRDTLQRMKITQPKFQPKQPSVNTISVKRFNVANYTAGEDPYESPPPEDEFDSLVRFRNKKTLNLFVTQQTNSIISSHCVSNSATIEVRQVRPNSLTKHKPRQANYSPNNIRVIEGRSTFTLQKHQSSFKDLDQPSRLYIFVKRLRSMIVEVSRDLSHLAYLRDSEDPMNDIKETVIQTFRYREIKRCLRNPEYVQVIENEKVVDPQFKAQLFTLEWSYLSLKKQLSQRHLQCPMHQIMRGSYCMEAGSSGSLLSQYETHQAHQ